MNYFVITNRKRAIVALVHSIAFLALAGAMWRPPHVLGFGSIGSGVLTSVYCIVTAILLWLAIAAKVPKEKIYFGLCATSAAFGLVRMTVPGMSIAIFSVYMRVGMLSLAVIAAMDLIRAHARAAESRVEAR